MKNSSLTRRRFLQVSGALSLLPVLPASARSAIRPPAPIGKFFVLLRAFGGMDVTLGLDPWTVADLPLATDMFIEYRQDELIEAGGILLGPSCAPLKAHAGDFSVINGVFMSQIDNGHGASLDYISAGSTSSTAPTLPIEIARSTTEGAFGVLTDRTLSLGDRVVSSSMIEDLKELPKRIDLTSLLEKVAATGGRTAFAEAIARVLASGAETRSFIQNLQSFGAPESLTDGQVLAAAFMSDVASSAQLDVSNGQLDTHASHVGAHKLEQTNVWTKVADLIQLFKNTPYGSGSLFDHTTFMVVSEFARTPALNGAGGKDHNPMTNSVLLAGRGIKGGQVIGASRLVTAVESSTGESYHIAYPIDYATFEVQRSRTPEARMIFPENVAQTVAAVMGVDWNLFHSVPKEILPLSALIRT